MILQEYLDGDKMEINTSYLPETILTVVVSLIMLSIGAFSYYIIYTPSTSIISHTESFWVDDPNQNQTLTLLDSQNDISIGYMIATNCTGSFIVSSSYYILSNNVITVSRDGIK